MSEKPTPGATSSIEDQIRLREEKARDLLAGGQHPYGNAAQVGSTTEHVKDAHPDRGAVHRGRPGGLPHPDQGAAAASGEVARPVGRGDAVPAALPGPDG